MTGDESEDNTIPCAVTAAIPWAMCLESAQINIRRYVSVCIFFSPALTVIGLPPIMIFKILDNKN